VVGTSSQSIEAWYVGKLNHYIDPHVLHKSLTQLLHLKAQYLFLGAFGHDANSAHHIHNVVSSV